MNDSQAHRNISIPLYIKFNKLQIGLNSYKFANLASLCSEGFNRRINRCK